MAPLWSRFSNKKIVENCPFRSKVEPFWKQCHPFQRGTILVLPRNRLMKMVPLRSQNSSSFAKDIPFSAFFGRKRYLFAMWYQNSSQKGAILWTWKWLHWRAVLAPLIFFSERGISHWLSSGLLHTIFKKLYNCFPCKIRPILIGKIPIFFSIGPILFVK